MADDGHAHAAPGGPAAPSAPSAPSAAPAPIDTASVAAHANQNGKTNGNVINSPVLEEIASLTSPRLFTPNPFSRKNTSLDVDDYFVCTPSPAASMSGALTRAIDRSP